jgi:hypothetical protein
MWGDGLCNEEVHAVKTYGWRSVIAPFIRDLGTRWRSVVSFTPRPLYPLVIKSGKRSIGGWMGPRTSVDFL